MSKVVAQRGRLAVATLLASIAVAVSGCGGSADKPAAAPAAEAAATSTSAVPAGNSAPGQLEVEIPKIKAKSSLVSMGLNADQSLQVPPVETPMQAGIYGAGPKPGEVGPAVIMGHVDGNKAPGIFYKLREIVKGDEVLVKKEDGKTLKFVVYDRKQVDKDKFPTDQVYGDTKEPELRLITCGGKFDKSQRSYEDNILVFAKLAA